MSKEIMTTLQMLHTIERKKVIYAIVYRRAGVALQFYTGDKFDEDFRKDLTIDHYYPSFEAAVAAEFDKLKTKNGLST